MRFLVFLLIIPLLGVAGKKEETIRIQIKHQFGNQPLKLDSQTYYNNLKQDIVVTKLKYYISNIGLTASTTDVKEREIILVDEENAATKKIDLAVDKKTMFQALVFNIGVDSLFHVSGAQNGALDPVNGMFWTWNTGYIFMKLEGKSSFSTAAGNNLEYHLGGYKHPYNHIRKIVLPFKQPIAGADLLKSNIELVVDFSEFFKNPNDIDFSVFPTATEPSNADFVVDNYIDMFKLNIVSKQ